MSKHRHTNYNQINKEGAKALAEFEAEKNAREANRLAVIREAFKDDLPAAEPVVEEAPVEAELPTIEGDGNEPLVGVTKTRLNIRENPEVAANNIVAVVNEGTVLMIDYPVADGDWFKVYTETGIAGYCMKEFVKTNN